MDRASSLALEDRPGGGPVWTAETGSQLRSQVSHHEPVFASALRLFGRGGPYLVKVTVKVAATDAEEDLWNLGAGGGI